MNATNFVLYSAGTLLCALSIYAFLAAICKMVLSFNYTNDLNEYQDEIDELERANDDLREENAALQEAVAQVYHALTAGEEAVERTADDVEAELEAGETCHGDDCCGGTHGL